MAKVPNGVKTLPKISIAWVGCTNVTDDRRQTDGQTTTYSEHEHEFTFANKTKGIQNLSDIEHVDTFKLLGIYVSSDLSWNNHVTNIYKSANSRLHFLQQLKRAVVSCKDILRFYTAVIHPVLEYAAPVWHTGLTAELAESLDSVQKHILRIIFGGNSFTNSTHLSFCESLAISSLQFRRETLSTNFFHTILKPSSCVQYLIPNKRCNNQLNKLRNHSYSPLFTHTEKFKSSFLVHALYHYVKVCFMFLMCS